MKANLAFTIEGEIVQVSATEKFDSENQRFVTITNTDAKGNQSGIALTPEVITKLAAFFA